MDLMSDSPITESEFHRFKQQCLTDGVPLPSHSLLQRKHDELVALDNRQLTADEIAALIKKRKEAKGETPAERLIRRAKLRKALEDAREKEDEKEVKRLEGELQELDDSEKRAIGPAGSENERRRRMLEKAREYQAAEKEKKKLEATRVKAEPGVKKLGAMRIVKKESFGGAAKVKEEAAAKEVSGVGLESASQVPAVGSQAVKGKGVEDVIAGLDIEIEL